MSARFDAALAAVLAFEGGYSDDPRDPGGPTGLGVTLATARAEGLDLDGDGDVDARDVRRIGRSEARPLYRRRFWDAIGADALAPGVDLMAFDAAVNQGPGRARRWLAATAGLDPPSRVAALSRLRRRHYQSLPAFPIYGRGWLTRLSAIGRQAHIWAIGQ